MEHTHNIEVQFDSLVFKTSLVMNSVFNKHLISYTNLEAIAIILAI